MSYLMIWAREGECKRAYYSDVNFAICVIEDLLHNGFVVTITEVEE